MKQQLLFIVESGTDVRLIEGLANTFALSVIARRIEGGVEISQNTGVDFRFTIGPTGRVNFARFVFFEILRRRSQTDLVLVQGYSLAALAANAARQITGIPTIMLVCSPVEAYYRCRLSHPSGAPYRKLKAIGLDLLARANALTGERCVVLSDYLKSLVRSHGGKRIHTIPIYGVDTSIFRPPDEPKSAIKARLGLPIDGTLIFFSSRIAPEKDSETLLRAVRRLLDNGQSLWLLHRSGGYRQFLADAERCGIQERVIATDAVHPHHQLPLDYQACDICVQASREEGLGFSPLEALACETPVIATSIGGLRETILNGRTGWTYSVGDDLALAKCLQDVITNPAEAARRSTNGRALVREKFDRHFVFGEFSKLADNLVGSLSPSFLVDAAGLADEITSSESAQQFRTRTSDLAAIPLLHAKRDRENASIMAERTVFPLPTALEQVGVDRKRDRAAEFEPQRLRKYAALPQRPLNIACVIHSSRDKQTAVFKNTSERVQYLQQLGHRCTVVAPEDFPLLRKLDGRLIPLIYPLFVARWLTRHREIDVALFHSYAGWGVTFAKRHLGLFGSLRTAIVFHGLEPLYYSRLKQNADKSGARLSWRYRLVHGGLMMGLLRSSTRYADILMCLNSEEARYLLDHDWASRGRVTVLANHAPKAFFIERIYRGRATQLLFVGQWLPMKGTRVLVEAFTRLRRIHPDLRLCCAGTLVPNKDVLKSFPADIQDSVSVFQRVTEQELLDLHRSADIFVFPTLSEGSSLALTEAMTSGLPIVTTPVGSAPDVLTHNRSALFVPNDDADATIGALNILLDNRSLRSQLGQNAQAAADALRPEYTMHDFGVCFELLAHATQPSENVMKFRAKAVRGSE